MQIKGGHLLLQLSITTYLLGLTASSVIARNASSLLLSPQIKTASDNSLNDFHARPKVPFEWRVPHSETRLLVVWYYQKMESRGVYSCIIESLAELYATAVYDHDDMPVRANSYAQNRYGVLLDVTRYNTPETPILYYSLVVRTLLGISQLFNSYHQMWGLSLHVYEREQKVAHATLKPARDPSVA